MVWIAITTSAAISLLTLFTKDARKAGLITTLFVIVCFTTDQARNAGQFLYDSVEYIWVHHRVEIKTEWVFVPEVVLLAILSFFLARKLKTTRSLTAFLNVMALLLLSFPLTQSLAVKLQNTGRPKYEPTPYAIAPSASSGKKPDIYYIILDGYARSDIMKSHFDFDDSPFLERLEKKGFYLAKRSTANYCQTPLCLSCSLNSVYLDKLVVGLEHDQTQLSDFIGKNNLMATLRPLGYKFVTFSTGFDPTEHPEADAYLAPYKYSTGFERMLIDQTPLQILWPDPKRFSQFQLQRERILYLLEHLPDITKDAAPTFTFAHLLCPHLPFVFGEDGQDINRTYTKFSLQGADKSNGRFNDEPRFIKGYRDQSAFIVKRIEETIDRILAASPEPPIIILQSDHGSELHLDRFSMQNSDMKERMSILNAYYFPEKQYQSLYDRISPVNSFRVVLNTFFGGKIPLLEDRSYFSTWDEPYQFHDVTKDARSPDTP
jgi:hypothetical protein